ncbi:MAG: glycosyltransferase family 39 protein [Planctomycetota bacterium]
MRDEGAVRHSADGAGDGAEVAAVSWRRASASRISIAVTPQIAAAQDLGDFTSGLVNGTMVLFARRTGKPLRTGLGAAALATPEMRLAPWEIPGGNTDDLVVMTGDAQPRPVESARAPRRRGRAGDGALGDFVVPTLGGQPFLEKPPLSYATGALLVRWLGTEPARTIRAASALYALGTIAAVFAIGRILFGSDVAQFACLLLATTLGFYVLAHFIVTDAGLPARSSSLPCTARVRAFAAAAWKGGSVRGGCRRFLCKGVIGCVSGARRRHVRARGEQGRLTSCDASRRSGCCCSPARSRRGSCHLPARWWRALPPSVGQNVERFLGKQAASPRAESAYYQRVPVDNAPTVADLAAPSGNGCGERARDQSRVDAVAGMGTVGSLAALAVAHQARPVRLSVIAPFSLLVARDLMTARGASRLMRGWVIVLALLAMIGPPLLLAAGVSGIDAPRCVDHDRLGPAAAGHGAGRGARRYGRQFAMDDHRCAGAARDARQRAAGSRARDAVVSFESPVERLAAHLRRCPTW